MTPIEPGTTVTERPSVVDLRLFSPGLVEQLAHRTFRPAAIPPKRARLAIVALAWVPLAVFSALEGTLRGPTIPFAGDIAVHVRLLITLPVLLAAAGPADALVLESIRYVPAAALLDQNQRGAFAALVRRVARAKGARLVPIVLFVVALSLSLGEVFSMRSAESSWRLREGSITLAGWWYALVGRPLMLAQLLSWLFRFGLWSYLVAKLSRIVRVIEAHPDKVGGLGGLVTAHYAFAVLAFAVGADLASAMANRIVHVQAHLDSFGQLVVFVVVVTTVVLLAPLLFFTPVLLRARLASMTTIGEAASIDARRNDEHFAVAVRNGAHGSRDELSAAFARQFFATETMRLTKQARLLAVDGQLLVAIVVAVGLPFVVASLAELSIGDILARIRSLSLF